MPQIRTIQTSGSIPTTNQLALGDIAINSYDGKAYIKQASGSTQSIIQLGSGTGGSSISASYALSASFASNGGVTQLIAGTNVTLSPTNGKGAVTVNATIASSGSGSPNGPLYSLQYNNGGLFSGSQNFTLLNNNALYLTGSLNISGSITGSLFGTSSWSSNSISSSYSLSSSFALSASFAENTTVVNNNTNNYVITGTGTSGTLNGESNLTFDGTTLIVTGDASITGNTVTNIQFNNQPVNMYTLGAADASKLVEMDVSIGNTVTVPTNASVGFAIGTQIMIVQQGTGQTTIAAAGGVTLRSAGGLLNLASQYSSCTVVKRGTDEWYVFGDLA